MLSNLAVQYWLLINRLLIKNECSEMKFFHFHRDYRNHYLYLLFLRRISLWGLNFSHLMRKCCSVSILFSQNGQSHSFIPSPLCLPIDNSWFDRRILVIARILLLFLVLRKLLICSDRNWYLRAFSVEIIFQFFKRCLLDVFNVAFRSDTNRIQGVSSQDLPQETMFSGHSVNVQY